MGKQIHERKGSLAGMEKQNQEEIAKLGTVPHACNPSNPWKMKAGAATGSRLFLATHQRSKLGWSYRNPSRGKSKTEMDCLSDLTHDADTIKS